MSPFSEASVEDWALGTAGFLTRTYADYFRALGVSAQHLLPLCYAVQRWGKKFDCVSDRDLKQLCSVAVSLGHRFWRDPRFGHAVMTTIEVRDMTRTQAVQGLIGHSTDWLETLWQDDSVQEFGERMCALLVGGYSPTPANLRYVLPGHGAMFSPEDEAVLLNWLNPRLPACQYAHQRLAYICLALPFGTEWWNDPQYRQMAHHVSAQDSAQALVNRLLPIFRALP